MVGYTTGACAAAAAKGAVILLFSHDPKNVKVLLPNGEIAEFDLVDKKIKDGKAYCCVVKNAGGAFDITHKAKICAEAKISKEIRLKGGKGVGVATKPGLKIEVGEHAINPVPREMILREVESVLPSNQKVEITVYVPNGEEIAKKTMNEKLGIVGGISILGTTGVVKPISQQAFKDSLALQIDVAIASGYDEVVMTPGRIGEKNAIERGIPRDAVIQMGNFVGFMLKECSKKGIKKVLLLGHVSKLIKVAAGFFYTHSKCVDSAQLFVKYASKAGLHINYGSVERAAQVAKQMGSNVFDQIAKDAWEKTSRFEMTTGVALLSMKGDILGKYNTEKIKWGKFL
jgi:cobalt-precorrin-5B (C1)-methyltransferase